MLNYDHPLSNTGINQAIELNSLWKKEINSGIKDPLATKFLNCDLIFASPLTRAAQTCILGLKGHPHLKENNIILLSSCREIKGFGGLDTVGSVYGEKIESRVKHKLGDHCDNEINNIHFDTYDCDSVWWTVDPADTKSDIDHRFEDFCSTLKFKEHKNAIIVVGHSLFIKDFCKKYLSNEIKETKQKLTENLLHHRMSNAGCLYTRINFSEYSNPRIIDADVLFQTTFIK